VARQSAAGRFSPFSASASTLRLLTPVDSSEPESPNGSANPSRSPGKTSRDNPPSSLPYTGQTPTKVARIHGEDSY
jgi:hypothetical protein